MHTDEYDNAMVCIMNAPNATFIPDYIETEHRKSSVTGSAFYYEIRQVAQKKQNFIYTPDKEKRLLPTVVSYCTDKIQEDLREKNPQAKPIITQINPYVKMLIKGIVWLAGGLLLAGCIYLLKWN